MKRDIVASGSEGHDRLDEAELAKTAGRSASLPRRAVQALAAIPLFYRLLVFAVFGAAGAVVLAVWVTSAHIARQASGDPHWGIAIGLIAVGLGVTLAINFAVMRMAFRPIESLEAAIGQIRRGRSSARAQPSVISDNRIERLIQAFNELADSLEGQRAQLTQLSARVLAAHEEERRRVARELHDEAGQALTSLLLGLKALEKVSSESQRRERLATLRSLASDILVGLRRIARDLRPPILDDLGLGPALKTLLGELSESYGLRIQQEFGDDVGESLSKEAEVVLYRIVQEALTNVAKHARARSVRVKLELEGGAVRVSIEDDGVGFEVTGLMDATITGLGLHGMQDRVALVGGSLEIRSHPGRGTTVVGEVPVRTEES